MGKRIGSRVSRRHLYTVFTAALVTRARRWKQHKCPLTNEWINQMWSMQTMEQYSAFKRKETLSHATTWMNPEDVVLSEISSHQRTSTV